MIRRLGKRFMLHLDPPLMAGLGLLMLAAGWASAGDQLLVVHKGASTLGFYDASTGRLEAEVSTGAKPHEFGLSPDGRYAYVTDYGADTYYDAEHSQKGAGLMPKQ